MKILTSVAIIAGVSLLAFTAQTHKIAPDDISLAETALGPEMDEVALAVQKLAQCESGGLETAVNWEDGGSPSYGLLQFKEGTWAYFIERYDLLPAAEPSEYMNLIYDGDFQRYVAYHVLSEDIHNLSHWKNCSIKMGLV